MLNRIDCNSITRQMISISQNETLQVTTTGEQVFLYGENDEMTTQIMTHDVHDGYLYPMMV